MGIANRHRGEISARFDGCDYRLCLTLGALAELESAFGETDMAALATRFEGGRLSASDAIAIIGAGLRGAGHDIDDAEVGTMRSDGGAAGSFGVVVRLLEATFGDAADSGEVAGAGTNDAAAPGEVGSGVRPFRGTT